MDLGVPTRLASRANDPAGNSLYPRVGGHSGWQLFHGEPEMPPQLDVSTEDFRSRIRADTASPYHGRHCLRLLLLSPSKTILPVPLHASSYGVEGGPKVHWTLRLRMRADPAPATLTVASGGCYIGGPVKNSSGYFGSSYIPCPQAGAAEVGRVLGTHVAEPRIDWSEVAVKFENVTLHSQNIWLNFSTAAELGTRVWSDAVVLTNGTKG